MPILQSHHIHIPNLKHIPGHKNYGDSEARVLKKMAAKLALSSTGLATKLSSPSKLSSPNTVPQTCNAPRKRARQFKILAGFGGGDAEVKKEEKKKFITRDEEPEQYWQTAGEREGENPMKTPLPYIIIFGMSTPFIILAVAFLNGWIKVPVR